MSQNVVTDVYNEAYEGMLYGIAQGSPQIDSGISSEIIYFGKGVSIEPATDIGDIPPTISLFTDTKEFYGVAIADITLERMPDPATGVVNQAPYGAYLAGRAVGCLRKGRIWVISDTAVDDRSKAVYVRDEDDVGTAATVTSTTFSLTSLDGESTTVTMAGFADQTVTFGAGDVDAASVAATLNQNLVGCKASVTGGQVKLETDLVGDTQTIDATDVGTQIVWGTPVAGTGNVASYSENSRGSFRCAATGGIVGFTELSSTVVKWRYGKTINAKYFGLLEVNLP